MLRPAMSCSTRMIYPTTTREAAAQRSRALLGSTVVEPVSVIFGGPSPEHDVSVLTGLQAERALREVGRSVVPIFWDKAGGFHQLKPGLEGSAFIDGVPSGSTAVQLVADSGFCVSKGMLGKSSPLTTGVVINCCHGAAGEDGALQGAFDLAGVSYSGPDVASAALCMDKLAFAGLVKAAGLPALPRELVDTAPGWKPTFDGPYMVKPRRGGSSIGIHVAADVETAVALTKSDVHLQDGALIEPYRPDSVDLNVAVRAWPQLEISAIEKPVRSSTSAEILTYADKYIGGEGMASAPREVPAKIDPTVAKRVHELATEVSRLVGIRGVARIDFLFEDDELFVNEVNNPPGSMARYLWVDPVIPFATLLADLETEAVRRPARRFSSAGADGTVLRSAGSIAAKLA